MRLPAPKEDGKASGLVQLNEQGLDLAFALLSKPLIIIHNQFHFPFMGWMMEFPKMRLGFRIRMKKPT